MNSDFYILNYSFRYREDITKTDLENKIQSLALDYDYIRQYKDTDKIYVHPSIYEETIYPDFTVVDFLYNPKTKQIFDRDVIEYLRTIIEKSQETEKTVETVIDVLLKSHSANHLYGLICLHKIENINDIFLIYNKHNWLEFHRHFLGLYPQNADFFYQECTKYFPNLFLHKRNINEMEYILHNFAKKIIFHLSALNDKFSSYKVNPYNRNETLKRFSIGCSLDETASSEGNISHKRLFTFNFTNDFGEDEKICCEPHLKLCHSDNFPGDSEYYYHRIYFHEGKTTIQNGKILIGHIGEHL